MATKKHYTIIILDSVKKILVAMSEPDRAKTAANITVMSEGEFNLVYTKILRTPIRELIIKKYRFLFFIHGHFLYFIHSFTKQSKKTPKREIDYAKKIYQILIEK